MINNSNIRNLIKNYIENKLTEEDLIITQNKLIGEWDVSQVTHMDCLFCFYTTFNENINNWDVSNAITMRQLFNECREFNQPLDKWDTSNVYNMNAMFQNCDKFNQPLDTWNTTKLKTSSSMFYGCLEFNQPLNTNGNNWNTSNIVDMSYMFQMCRNFNQPLNNWITSNVIKMNSMFSECIKFNQSLKTSGKKWDVSNVMHTKYMFASCEQFNQSLRSWKLLKIKDYENMFIGAKLMDNSMLPEFFYSNIPELKTRQIKGGYYDFFNFTNDMYVEKIKIHDTDSDSDSDSDKEVEIDEPIILKMIPKGTLLFTYINPTFSDNIIPGTSNQSFAMNTLLAKFLSAFYLDGCAYDYHINKMKMCMSNNNTRLKYFYGYPAYANIMDFGHDSVCLSFRTKRDIYVASLKTGTDISSNYSRGAYMNVSSKILSKCNGSIQRDG